MGLIQFQKLLVSLKDEDALRNFLAQEGKEVGVNELVGAIKIVEALTKHWESFSLVNFGAGKFSNAIKMQLANSVVTRRTLYDFCREKKGRTKSTALMAEEIGSYCDWMGIHGYVLAYLNIKSRLLIFRKYGFHLKIDTLYSSEYGKTTYQLPDDLVFERDVIVELVFDLEISSSAKVGFLNNDLSPFFHPHAHSEHPTTHELTLLCLAGKMVSLGESPERLEHSLGTYLAGHSRASGTHEPPIKKIIDFVDCANSDTLEKLQENELFEI